MYHAIVRKIVVNGFRRLSNGDYRPLMAVMAERCHYHFVGCHALGGSRRGRALIEQWFERFLRILPGFQFVPNDVLVIGWPWNTRVAVRLNVSWPNPEGIPYTNVALQMITLRWFKAVEVLTVDDSQAFASLLKSLAEQHGVPEAIASPIEG
jgi:ketosteroid isomerase-like protein